MAKKTSQLFNECVLFFLFLGGLLFIGFLTGAAAFHFKLPPYSYFIRAFEGGEAWWEKMQTFRQEEDVDDESVTDRPLPENQNPAVLSDRRVNLGKVTLRKNNTYGDYTLYTLGHSTSAYLVDMKGTVVHRWKRPFYAIWPNPPHIDNPVPEEKIFLAKAHLYPNGDLLAVYGATGDTPYGYGLVKLDRYSNVIWSFSAHVHHDIYVASNQNIFVLRHDIVSSPIPGLEFLSYPVLADSVVILSPDGKPLDSIPFLEAFRDSSYLPMLYAETPTQTRRGDVTHANSVAMIENGGAKYPPHVKPGQLLISLRNNNAITVIDPEKRKVVWAQQGLWRAQHDARLLKNGNVLLFDNRGHFDQERERSRILEFNPDTQAIEWRYAGTPQNEFYSQTHGRVQPLPNGNLLLTESDRARIMEITRKKNVVWEYRIPQVDINKHFRQTIITSALRYGKNDLPFLEEKSAENVQQPAIRER